MNIIRTLGFAAVAALSLGAGAAMAQVDGIDAGSAAGSPRYQAQLPWTTPARPATPAVQSGSSDVYMQPAPLHPGNYYDIGTGGGAGS